LKYGRKVVQIDPGTTHSRIMFLHVLTATEAEQTLPPKVAFRVVAPGRIEVTVDDATTVLAVPEEYAQP